MYFQELNRTDADTVFTVGKNIYSTSALFAGDVICFDVATFDGHRVTKPATANLNLPAGVAAEGIAINDIGIIQCYGFRNDVDVGGTTSAVAGDQCIMANASFDLAVITAGLEVGKGTHAPLYVIGTGYTPTTAIDKAVFIRCL